MFFPAAVPLLLAMASAGASASEPDHPRTTAVTSDGADVELGVAAPLPAPGETVVWTVGMSPIVIDETVRVPEGAELVVESGVEIRFDNETLSTQSALLVFGEMRLEGTAAEPIVLRRVYDDRFPRGGVVASIGGQVIGQHIDSNVTLSAATSGVMRVTDARVWEPLEATETPYEQQLVAGIVGRRATVSVERVTIENGRLDLDEGYVFAKGLTLDAGWYKAFRRHSPQTVAIDGLVARNHEANAPIQNESFNVWLGPDSVIENNLWPVRLAGGGLAPGSFVPSSGNTNNEILVSRERVYGYATLAEVGVPYRYAFDSSFAELLQRLEVEPGVTVRFEEDARIAAHANAEFVAEGTPEKPIVLEGIDGGSWHGVEFLFNAYRPKLRHTILRDAERGVQTTQCQPQLRSVVLEDNDIGGQLAGFGSLEINKSVIRNNGVGISMAPFSSLRADGDGGTNSFTGNGIGIATFTAPINGTAKMNWWGDASGPQSFENPDGEGEVVDSGVDVVPFRATPPTAGDHPPIVDVERMFPLVRTGDTVFVSWDARDDGAIVEQEVYYSFAEGAPLELIADDLPPGQRSLEFTIPEPEPTSLLGPGGFRVVAVDENGQRGWGETTFLVSPFEEPIFEVITDVAEGFTVGERYTVCWSIDSTFNAYIYFPDEGYALDLGAGVGCSANRYMPAVSTDIAQFVVQFDDQLAFSEPFTIRPPAATGDEAPTVQLDPLADESFRGGSTLPLTWTASDDEGLRSFDLYVSTDGGKLWHPIVRGLEGSTRAYDWTLPPSDGLPEARVRVVARDHRFQVSSDMASISIQAGDALLCPADLNGNGIVGATDLGILIGGWGDGSSVADINGDGVVDAGDLAALIGSWGNCQ